MKRAWILMFSCAVATASAAQVGDQLPDMGNPVDAIITRGDEYRIGLTPAGDVTPVEVHNLP